MRKRPYSEFYGVTQGFYLTRNSGAPYVKYGVNLGRRYTAMIGNIHKHLVEAGAYLQYKILAGLVAVVFSDDFFKLITVFFFLELLDIFTRWIALSKQCYKDIYPQSPCGIRKAICFLYQAHRWRYIKSAYLRDGFADKMLLYLFLLLTGALVDAALQIGHTPRVVTTIIVVVLGSTEALSILENLSECDIGVVSKIRDKVKAKFDEQK